MLCSKFFFGGFSVMYFFKGYYEVKFDDSFSDDGGGVEGSGLSSKMGDGKKAYRRRGRVKKYYARRRYRLD